MVSQDGKIWANESGAALLPVLEPIPLELPEELASEMELIGRNRLDRRGTKKLWPYQPQRSEHYWGCGCGQMNLRDVCLNCGVDQTNVFELTNYEYLAQKREERLAEQQRLEAERAEERARKEAELRQKVSEQTQAAKETASKLVDKSKDVVKQSGDILSKNSRAAYAKVSGGWQSLQEKTLTFWRGKILPNKKRIIPIIAATLVLCAGIPISIYLYQNYQNQKAEEARILEERRIEEQKRQEEARRKAEAEALAEKIRHEQQTQEEFDQLIEALPLHDGLHEGAGFADYFDMDLDGTQELLVITYNGDDINSLITMEIYGEADGHVKQISDSVNLIGGRNCSIELVQNDRGVFVKTSHMNPGIYIPSHYYFYGLNNREIYCANRLAAAFKQEGNACWVDFEDDGIGYIDEDTVGNVSEDEYNAVEQSYSILCKIITDYSHDDLSWLYRPVFSERGILPDIPEDTLRKVEFAKELIKERSSITYAKLLDENRDGIEELVVLREVSKEYYGSIYDRRYFRIYSWNGSELVAVDLDQTSDPTITRYLLEEGLGFADCSIQQEKSTGDIYFVYYSEIVGGWCGTLFINAKDHRFYGEPFYPADLETWPDAEIAEFEAEYEKDMAAYQDSLNLYSLVEDCGNAWNYDLMKYTVDEVLQQLINE